MKKTNYIHRNGSQGRWLLSALLLAFSFVATSKAWPQGTASAPQAADQRSDNAGTLAALDRAYALLRSGRLEEATAAFECVLASDPANRTARLELGYLNARLGQWDAAARYFESVSRREPGSARLRLDLGYALQNLGELERAAQEFQAIAETPGEFQSQARAALETVRLLQAQRANRRDTLLRRAYGLLRVGNRTEARLLFEQALAEDPRNPVILKEIGYLALAEGNLNLAAEKFAAAHEVVPQDYLAALQLGYTYTRLHQVTKAEAAFRAALSSPDPDLARAARAALSGLPGVALRRVYVDIFTSPLYASRFTNAVSNFEERLHWRPNLRGPVSFYLGGRVTQDSRSFGGALPAIVADNVGLLGVGINISPRRWNLNFRAEANLAFNLLESPSRPRDVEPDYRAVLSYYRRWDARLRGPIGAVTMGRLRGERLFTDLDASLGYYSRYRDNIIAYLQAREGLRLADFGSSQLAGYMVIKLVKDTNGDFYNNVGEAGVGLEWRPDRNLNLSLRAESLRGFYYGIQGREPNPFRPNYNDFRLTLFFGQRF